MRWVGWACLVWAGLVGRARADSLYDSSDPILELYTDTFNEAVYNTPKAHFVEFYSSWCGACIAYAPTFKKFARHLSPWSPIVQVTVVNCADDRNMPLCREHGISAFPTLKYFKYMSTAHSDAQHYQGDKYQLEGMEKDVAALVKADADQQKPTGWPSFAEMPSSSSISDAWASAGEAQLLGVAVQNEPASTAWALEINFHSSRSVRVAHISSAHPIAAQIGDDHFQLFKKGEFGAPLWSGDVSSWVAIQEKIDELITEHGGGGGGAAGAEQVAAPVAQAAPAAAGDSAINLDNYKVQNADLASALGYMLNKEIPRREVIDGENLAALKQWIHTLNKYAPGTTPVRRLLHRLDEWVQLKMDRVTADEWIAKVDSVQTDLGHPLPANATWLACQGSKPNLRGYTCGLWTLAHAVTVQAYKQDGKNPSFKPVVDVLEPFHQFIYRFLSCGECAQNFDKEAANHGLALVTRPEDVVMWLWRVHNSVNKRLSGAPAEDPTHVKRQFPPKALCPHCWNGEELDEQKSFDFMLAYYADVRTDPVKAAPGYKVSEFADGKMQRAGARRLNPKFAVHAEKVDKLEEAEERLRRELDASPQRQWRDIEGYESTVDKSSRSHFYLIWLTVIAVAIIIVYCKYKRNRSKFWKTFYYHQDFKL